MDHYFETLFDYIEQIHDLPEGDKIVCKTYFKPVSFKKGTIISNSGEVPEFHNFIVSGHLRNYHINEWGEEITVDLNEGPRFFTSYLHFSQQTVSPEIIECLTDVELLQISYEGTLRSLAEGETQQAYTIKLFEQLMEENKQHIQDMNLLTAEQRYSKLLATRPNIARNIPLKYIASYLGIKPESLSRIRRELLNKC